MIKTPLNLAMLGDPEAQQYCEMLSLSETFAPLTDGGCGPTGVVLADDSIRITFPTCVDIVATTGIEVNIGGAGWEAVASVSGGSDRIWEFETTTEIAEGDVVLWQYLGAEDSIVDCTEAVDVGALDPVTVRNPLELTAPTLVSAEVGTVDDSTFVLVFSEDLASADFAAGWSIEADATPLTVTGATEGPAGTLTITVSEDVTEGQTVTISYDADTGDIADVTGYPTANVLASITDEEVTNNSTTGNEVTLASIAVTPATPSLVRGATQQFTATGTYSDASTADLTATVVWASGNTQLATITAGGLAAGVSAGDVVISATSGAVSGSTTAVVPWGTDSMYSTGYATNSGFFVGDSVISYGWDVPVTNHLAELQNWSTGGKGIVGGTAPTITNSWNTNWPSRKANTTFAIIQGGVNDIKSFSITVAAMKVAFQLLLDDAIADVGAANTFVWNIAPWGNHAAWTAGYQTMTEEWNAWLAAQATAQGFVLVDMYALLGDPAHPEDLLAAYDVGDGIHPSAAGVKAQQVKMAQVFEANNTLSVVHRTHAIDTWVGGVEPAAVSPSGNQIKYWVGAVQPAA